MNTHLSAWYYSPAAIIALYVTGCGGDDAGGGELLVGQDCPDACIPSCHFVAHSAVAECFPHGAAVCDVVNDAGTIHYCFGNGVKIQSVNHGDGHRVDTTYDTNGSVCFVYDYQLSGNLQNELESFTLKGKDGALLEVVDFTQPPSKDVFAVTCGGMVRQVSLTVNATNPACAKCPQDPFAFPENPDPPSYQLPLTCDGVCAIP